MLQETAAGIVTLAARARPGSRAFRGFGARGFPRSASFPAGVRGRLGPGGGETGLYM